MIEKRLKKMPYANARALVYDDGTVALRSYRTIAIIVEDDWMTVTGLYSMTTRKHIGAFLKEYFNIYYHTARTLFENHWKMNVKTGEIREV